MRENLSLTAALLLLLTTACGSNRQSIVPKNDPKANLQQGRSIGSAWLDPDGTLVLQLRSETAAKGVGDALLRYPKGDKDYARILKHIGGLKQGEVKPVPEWPDEKLKKQNLP